MKILKRLLSASLCILLISVSFATSVSAVDFDDSYCEQTFDGKTLYTSQIKSNKYSGHTYDTTNGIYQYDWVHQVWDSDHEQLYVQQRYTMTVNMKPILVTEGEHLDSMTYTIKVAATSTDKLLTEYKTVNDISTPDGYQIKKIKVAGYDAVYVYTESHTTGDGQGTVAQSDNHGTVYVPIVGAFNENGKVNTLQITCSLKGESRTLYDQMVGTYTSLLENLPCTITLNKEEDVVKKGAPVELVGGIAEEKTDDKTEDNTGDNTGDETEKDEEGGFPVVPFIAITAAVIGGGSALVVAKKKTKKEPEKKAEKSEEEKKHDAYVEKLKEKYGYDDEKELKKAIMTEQIHNEKLGYIAQKDEAWAEAGLNTAEGAKTVADVSADIVGELGGTQGKVFKNVYTGLTEVAEGVGQVMTGRDATEALTEAVVDTSIGIIQNQADGVAQKLGANVVGGSAKDFADTYLATGGDMDKALKKAGEGAVTGLINTGVDVVSDGLVDKAVGKAVKDTVKEASEEALKAGVNASKAFSQDLTKNALND